MKELMNIQAKLNAPKGQYNKFGNYKYRSCEDILSAVKPLLEANSCTLTICDDVVMVGNRIYIKATATLKNEKGDSETSTAFAREEEAKKGMDSSQVTGSASSYARKYALNGLFAIDDTKDSDATNNGQQAQTKHSQQMLTNEQIVKYAKEQAAQATTKEHLVAIYELYGNIPEVKTILSERRKQIEKK